MFYEKKICFFLFLRSNCTKLKPMNWTLLCDLSQFQLRCISENLALLFALWAFINVFFIELETKISTSVSHDKWNFQTWNHRNMMTKNNIAGRNFRENVDQKVRFWCGVQSKLFFWIDKSKKPSRFVTVLGWKSLAALKYL